MLHHDSPGEDLIRHGCILLAQLLGGLEGLTPRRGAHHVLSAFLLVVDEPSELSLDSILTERWAPGEELAAGLLGSSSEPALEPQGPDLVPDSSVWGPVIKVEAAAIACLLQPP